MPSTTINSFPYPDGAGAASIALYFQQLALAVDKRSVPVFTNDAARDAAIPSPTSGMVCVSGSRLLMYRAGVWAKQGGPRELLYEDGDAGASGTVNVGAGPQTVLSVSLPAAGVAADTAHAHVVIGLKSSGTTVGNAVLSVNGVATAGQIFNLDSASSIPFPLEMPASIPSGTFGIAVAVSATLGSSCSMSYSSVRVTF